MPILRGWTKSLSHIGSALAVLRVLDSEGTHLKNCNDCEERFNIHEHEKERISVRSFCFLELRNRLNHLVVRDFWFLAREAEKG